jgi:cell division protein FtsA
MTTKSKASMSNKSSQNYIAALDIGTTKVVCLIGEKVSGEQPINIIGFGSHPSRGLKRGVVVNIEMTVQAIQRAVEEAELMAGCSVERVFVGIAGSHIKSLNSHGIVAIRNHEVTQADIDRVIEAAKAVAIPADQKIIHVLPSEYIIDGQEGIRDPLGMSGVRLEARIHIVSGAVSAAANIVKCIERCGLRAEDVILEQLASSYAVLTEDEKDLGACMIDIGGGTTDIAVFVDGAIRHSAVIPIAGDQVTNDIAIAIRTPTKHAESLKLNYGAVIDNGAHQEQQQIEVPSVGGRAPRLLSPGKLVEVMEPRYAELFALAQGELRRSGFEELLTGGIVLTGGGSRAFGGRDLAEEAFDLPVRVGHPHGVVGLADIVDNPIYATVVGLLTYGCKAHLLDQSQMPNYESFRGVWDRMCQWFQYNF